MVDQRVNRTLKVAAGMGKGRDKYIGHLAHGEVVLPIPFQRAYPGLILDLKRAFERAGLDFNRYIVGHDHNRINESTGIPMFEGDGDGASDGASGGGAGMGPEGGDMGGYGSGAAAGSSGSGASGSGASGSGASGGASSGAGMGPEGGDMAGYGGDAAAGSSGSYGGGGMGGGSGDGGGHEGRNTPDPAPAEEPPPIPEKKPIIPLTPENTGIKLTYDPIGNSTFAPATPTDMTPTTFTGNGMPATPPNTSFASGSTVFEPGQQPAFADGGIVDAALNKVSSKYSDTGLPLNAMQILSKIARTG